MRSVLVVSCAALLLATGCASGGAVPRLERSPQTRYVVQVDSRHWSDVTIYAVTSGIRTRLGLVPAAGRATLTVPGYLLDESGMRLHLVADPVGSHEELDLGLVAIQPGQRALLTLEKGIARSHLGAW